jgi:hypothetical protein
MEELKLANAHILFPKKGISSYTMATQARVARQDVSETKPEDLKSQLRNPKCVCLEFSDFLAIWNCFEFRISSLEFTIFLYLATYASLGESLDLARLCELSLW